MLSIPNWCGRPTNEVLPNDLVINEEKGLISVVVRKIVGNEYLVIPKYRASHRGSWSTKYLGSLHRLIELYAPKAVKSTLIHTGAKYSPHYGVPIPVEVVSSNMAHIYLCSGNNIDPVRDISKLDEYSNYKWSNTISYLVEEIGLLEINTLIECIWPTGSLLLGSFREFSDIDIVFRIDTPSCYKRAIEFVESSYMSLPNKLQSALTPQYIAREAKWRDIGTESLGKSLRKWQRLRIGTTDISISLVNVSSRLKPETRIFMLTNKVVRKEVYIEPYQISAADYPSLVETSEEHIVSYDGIYVPLLFEGGKVVVQGIKAKIILGGEALDAIVVGVAESKTFMYRE